MSDDAPRWITHRPPLNGYNHNVRFHKRLYHVQTEDSGVENPRVFTHLFLEGMVVATLRRDYEELAGLEGEEEQVRSMMQRQHKEILRQLKQGDLDRQVEILLGQPADVVDMSPPSTELRLVSSASTLCKALGHITEQELRRRREGKRISAELSAVDLALPAGIPPRHPTLSGYPIIEMDLPNQELETTLRGLGELGRTPAVPVIVVDHSSEPRTDEDCFSGGNTARGYPAVSRVTPIEDALLGAIDPLEPVPVELERDESSGDRPKNV